MPKDIAFNANSPIENKTEHDEFSQPTTPHKVLIVDDNKDLVKTLEMALHLWGHEVRMANDGLSGIKIADSFVPEIVIIDIGMPVMDGYSVCKEMRKNPKLKNTVFFAQTGWGSPEHRRLSKEAGFDYHLIKPYTLASLYTLLENKEFKENEKSV